jgi:hypothetical protein
LLVGALIVLVLAVLATRAAAAPYGDNDDTDLGLERATSASQDERDPLGWIGEPPWPRVAPCDCDGDALARALASAPPLSEVIAAAERAAGLAGDPTPSWRRRSRLAALVPRVTLRAGNSESWRDIDDPGVHHAAALGGSVAWTLDRLVYDPNEPRFSTYDVARRRERRRLAHATSAAYFAWIEVVAAAGTDPRDQLTLMEAVAHLDAMTATWFSHTLAKRAGSR